MTLVGETSTRSDLAILCQWGACSEGYEFLASQPSLAVAWQKCERGDWMLWFLGRCAWPVGLGGSAICPALRSFGSPEHRHIVGCISEVALSLALPFCRDADWNVLDRAMANLARYANGEGITLDEMASARLAAYATYAAHSTHAACAIHAVHAYAAAYATHAAAAASAAVHAAAAASIHAAQSLRASAEIVRTWYPKPPRAWRGRWS